MIAKKFKEREVYFSVTFSLALRLCQIVRSQVARGNPGPPALCDSPVIILLLLQAWAFITKTTSLLVKNSIDVVKTV